VLYLTVTRSGRVDQSKTIRSSARLDDHRSHSVVIQRDNRRVSRYVISVSGVGVSNVNVKNQNRIDEDRPA